MAALHLFQPCSSNGPVAHLIITAGGKHPATK